MTAGIVSAVALVAVYAIATRVADSILVAPEIAKKVADVAEYWPMVERDLDAVERAGLLGRTTYEADAGAFLNRQFDWNTGELVKGSPLQVPDSVTAVLRSAGEAWPSLGHADIPEGVDLSWLDSLQAYDHWDLRSALLAVDPHSVDLFTPRLPLVGITFTTWGKLSLVLAQTPQEPERSLGHVRTLARILYSTNEPMNAVLAALLVRLEARYCAQRAAEVARVPNRQCPDSALAVVYRRVLAARAWAPSCALAPAELEKVLPQGPVRTGDCLALSNATVEHLVYRGMLGHALRKQRELIGARLDQYCDSCGLAALRDVWTGRDQRQVVGLESLLDSTRTAGKGRYRWVVRPLWRLPGLRSLLGRMLLTIAAADAFQAYRQMQPQSGPKPPSASEAE